MIWQEAAPSGVRRWFQIDSSWPNQWSHFRKPLKIEVDEDQYRHESESHTHLFQCARLSRALFSALIQEDIVRAA